MIQRCTNKNVKCYGDYGGRGIKVCDRWLHSFANFLADMGKRPAGKSLDRFPNNAGDYEPGNCRWATHHEQMQHTRRTRLITAAGRTQTLSVWARETGLSKAGLHARLARLTPEQALGLA